MTPTLTCFLIDDDKDDQEIFMLAVSDLNIPLNLVTADDGIQALKKLEDEPDFVPDYIFLDINMPRLNGLQCLVEIKKIERLKDTPVVIFTTSSAEHHRAKTTEYGAADFVSKPSTVDELSFILNKFFNSSKV